jgi:hypothetical protein
MTKHSRIILIIKTTVLILALYFEPFNVSAQNTYYIRSGKNITKVENSDPSKLNVTEWQVLLFKKGAAQVVGTQWGLITGKSSSQVMSQLKKDQDFELRYNAFMGKGRVQDAVFTNFNALGPVAVVENASSNQQKDDANNSPLVEKLTKVKQVYDQVKEYYDDYHSIMEVVNEPKPQTPFDNVGQVFKEYSDNLKEAFLRVNSLQNQLQKGMNLSIAQIDKNINEINNNLSVVKNNSKVIKQKLNINQGSKSSQGKAPKGSTEEFDKLSEQLTNAFANIDPNDPDAAYSEIKRISKLLAKHIQDDPDSDQKMKNLAAILLKIASTDDEDQLMEYLQKMIELLSDMD